MHKIFYRIILFAVITVMIVACKEEKPFGEGYDIMLPAVSVDNISNENPFVGSMIKLTGSNLNTVQSTSIGAYVFKIVKQYNDSIILEVPRVVEAGAITVSNKYKRVYVTQQIIRPQFYEAKVEGWPNEIQRGKAFELKGQNMDLIKDVKIGGKALSLVGSASPGKASYSTAGIDMGEIAIIEVTPKTGEKQSSPEIKVVAPRNNYVPRRTIMLFDLETTPGTGDGWSQGTYTAGVVNDGFFGKAYQVSSPQGNGWSGCYIKLVTNNGGQGFDLSAYNKPHITFLVNTKGKRGYVNPALTIGGTQSDKHFTGQGGEYSDNYAISTNDWEWRSYDLEKMGFANVKSKVDLIELWFRGGNVGSGSEFFIMVDQVMITDGPLTPGLIWDAEATAGGDLPILFNNGINLTGYSQGTKYASYRYTIGSDPWAWLGKMSTVNDLSLDPKAYENGIYINFLVNTGDTEGYAGFELVQGSNKLANQKLDPAYGDNYKFRATNNKWEWRSMFFDKDTWDVWGGSAANVDLSKPFTLSVFARGGNIASGVNAQLHLDYFIFTTVPLDPNLVTE
jgi:hypothetical protein